MFSIQAQNGGAVEAGVEWKIFERNRFVKRESPFFRFMFERIIVQAKDLTVALLHLGLYRHMSKKVVCVTNCGAR